MKNSYVIRVAILVDGAFFLMRYRSCFKKQPRFDPKDPKKVAKYLYEMISKHAECKYLYRILYYDAKPLEEKTSHPISKKYVDFATSDVSKFRQAFYEELKSMRKVALRLGYVRFRSNNKWLLRPKITKDLLQGKKTMADIKARDVYPDILQKGVDIRIGLDIASLAYKQLVDQIVLVSSDSDFIPAAKLARREGIDIILDPMHNRFIADKLLEHIDGVQTFAPKP